MDTHRIHHFGSLSLEEGVPAQKAGHLLDTKRLGVTTLVRNPAGQTLDLCVGKRAPCGLLNSDPVG